VRSVKVSARPISRSASRQLRKSDRGSRTNSETAAVRCSRKNDSHRSHSESVPASITFSRRPECVPLW
jgi:hypothetical protein